MHELFLMLYPLVAVLAVAGYVPQIARLWKADSAEDRISLQSWATWMATYVVSLGYGVTHLRDGLFVLTIAVNLAATCIVIGLVVYNRHIRFRRRAPVMMAAE